MKIKRVVCGNLEANCYVIYENEGHEAYVIDPGYSYKKYLKICEELNLKVKGILLTHHHYDHAGAARELKLALGCPIYIHRNELRWFKADPDVILTGGEILLLGGADKDSEEPIEVLNTPGHTAGGVCFYAPKSKVAFTGDTIFDIDLGYTHFEGGSAENMKKSLREVVNKWGNEVTIYPGHGGSSTMKKVREVNTEFLEAIE